MKPTDIRDPEYFHTVVDCQKACPAHTRVPEYIRLIAAKRYSEAYMVNWESNVFPGVLGRICDRPCEPVCRRGRVEKEPVAICRLKRVCADNKGDVEQFFPPIPSKNGKRVALIGGGPASLTVARDLLPLGYSVDLYDSHDELGGFIRSQIPSFRLPKEVLDEEINYIVKMGINSFPNSYISSMADFLKKGYDAIFVGTGAPRGKDLPLPGRREGAKAIHIGINWLAGVQYRHVQKIGKRVLVIGGGNTAMDCCRTARRLGGSEVQVVVRGSRAAMKASPWEVEDALQEDIPILEYHSPTEFVVENGVFRGVRFEHPAGSPLAERGSSFVACDEVLLAIGQENAFPWIEKSIGLAFDEWGCPQLDEETLQSSIEHVFFGGDAAFGPRNVITAVAHGHQAAISIDLFLRGADLHQRPAPHTTLITQKMGFHDWAYNSEVSDEKRHAVPHIPAVKSIKDRLLEVELGFDDHDALHEARRCLNCDIQTVFSFERCIECDACVDICPTSCITFTANGDEDDLRGRLAAPAQNRNQALYLSDDLKTGKVMVKDENVCLHCGLCAEKCPTGAWDMQKFSYHTPCAGQR